MWLWSPDEVVEAVIDHLGRTMRGERRMLAKVATFRSRRHWQQVKVDEEKEEQLAKGVEAMKAADEEDLKCRRGVAGSGATGRNMISGVVTCVCV